MVGDLSEVAVQVAAQDVAQQRAQVATELAAGLGDRLAGKVADAVRDVEVLARRDAEAIERIKRELGVREAVVVPLLDHDVHDLEGLARLERCLRDQPVR